MQVFSYILKVSHYLYNILVSRENTKALCGYFFNVIIEIACDITAHQHWSENQRFHIFINNPNFHRLCVTPLYLLELFGNHYVWDFSDACHSGSLKYMRLGPTLITNTPAPTLHARWRGSTCVDAQPHSWGDHPAQGNKTIWQMFYYCSWLTQYSIIHAENHYLHLQLQIASSHIYRIVILFMYTQQGVGTETN